MEPGIHNISMEEYHQDPCPEPSLTRSAIKGLINDTPAKVWFNHPRLNKGCEPEKLKEVFDLGTAAHSIFLEGLDKCCVVDAQDWRTKDAKEQRDTARAGGLVPLLRHQYEEVLSMVMIAKFALAHNKNIPVIDIVEEGLSEVSVIWKEGKTWCRCRPDWYSEGTTIIDYKTTSVPGGPDQFNRAIIQNGLDIQESFYRRGIKKVTGIDANFIFMIQETFKPYACFFVALPPQFQDMGRQKVEAGIRQWEWCMSHDKWPGYSDQIYYPDPQPWAMAQWDEKRFGLEVQTGGSL